MNSTSYKKRPGTSGVLGELYESKLISLIYFRLKHDDSVEQFSLASNRDGTGDFDDICFLLKIKGFDKPLAVFLQAKHRQNNQLLKFTNETDLSKYYNSYLKIRRSFDPRNKDMIFGRNFDDTECFFIMYTTAKDDGNNKIYEGIFNDYLDRLLGTGGSCTQPSYTDEDLDSLCKIVMKDEIRILAEQMAKFICDESDKEMWMNNDIMLRYHVLLALNVLDVSEIQSEGYRIASFRLDFFTNNDDFIVLIKNILCLEVLKKRKSEENDVHGLLLKFLKEPSDITTLSKLIGNVLTYRNDKLEFVSESITDDQKRQLEKANIPQSTVFKAVELAAKDYLLSLKLKVPASFGNKDLTIRGNHTKIEKRLKYLTTKIQELLKQSKPNHIVTIDESLGDGFLQLNGGIASAVGNILVFDETSKLLKFTDNCESLGNLSKILYETLIVEIKNLHEYKLDVKVKNFPKLSFERGEFDVSLVRDFYSKLLFYTNQANQKAVEDILRKEIEDLPSNEVNNFREQSDVIYLKYHDEIQRLWLLPEGSYLTEKCKVFENAIANVMSDESVIGFLKTMRKMKKNVITFNNNVMEQFASLGQIIGTTIDSVNCELTVAKVVQYLGSKKHTVLDLEYILTLPLTLQNILCKELTNTNNGKIFIVVCDSYLRNSDIRLANIAKAIDGKQVILITNNENEYFAIIKMFSLQYSNVWNDDRIAFTDLTVESQKKFLTTYKIILQWKCVSLDMVVDDKAVELIDNNVFYELINGEPVKVGHPGIYNNYGKQLYIDRRVSRIKSQEHDKFNEVKDKVIKTFYDLEDDVVLITAEQGMGKTTLLNHLSLTTKEFDPKVWIVKLNLSECQIEEKCFDFMCKAALGNAYEEDLLHHVETRTDYLEKLPFGYNFSFPDQYYHDQNHLFQLKIFLHYYTRGKLIFLIDDFDELIPEHKEIVDECLKLVKSNKIWITSASPSSNLEFRFGPSYKIENFSRREQALKDSWIWFP
ncbi:hypothetical protein PYW08_012768 [Mythimna loreyi]|uniref:Uncharacterized protein n=1 Tax=Mythimna loreyi TaxID=667449 RepID=A0ACC2Q128_9NEOP|nr:hypothetical protein PYW08_012768 [Mythimna loreyi]